MTEAEADGAAAAVEAPVTHAPRAKAKQKTPQQKSVLEEVFASTLVLLVLPGSLTM
jgi:hypothetical protein